MNPAFEFPPVSRTRRAIASLVDLFMLAILLFAMVVGQLQMKTWIYGRDATEAITRENDRVDSQHPDQPGWHYGYGNFKPAIMSQQTFDRMKGLDLLLIAGMALMAWFYFSSMESSHFQATGGKQLVGIKVVGLDGGRITLWRSSWRFGLAAIRALVLLYVVIITLMVAGQMFGPNSLAVDYASMAWLGAGAMLVVVRSGRRGQRLHDRLSGTRVVPRDWNVYRAGFYNLSKTAPGNRLFCVMYFSGWLLVLLLPAWRFFKNE